MPEVEATKPVEACLPLVVWGKSLRKHLMQNGALLRQCVILIFDALTVLARLPFLKMLL